MIKYNIKYFITAILVIASLIFFAIYQFKGKPSDIGSIVTILFNTIGIVSFLCIIFVRYAWKWSCFYPLLVQTPNLSGIWKGYMKSNYKKDGIKIDPIPFEINIKQNFFNTQIKLKTKESSSRSLAASFDIDKERGLSRIIYTYENEPKIEVKERSNIHKGTVILDFGDEFYIKKLEGKCYTDRGTEGDMALERI